MKIPTRFQLAGHIIPVILKKMEGEDRDSWGYFSGEDYTMSIDETASQPIREETYWHEAVEGINMIYELNLPHQLIQLLGLALHQIVTSSKYEEEKAGKGRQKGGKIDLVLPDYDWTAVCYIPDDDSDR